MNWIDLVLLVIVVLAMWAGWQKGFILGVVDLLVWIGSLLAGFFCYKFFGDFFQQTLPALGVWTLPLAFILAIVLARILLAFIFNRFLSATSREAHEHGVNHALGLVPGFVNGLLYATTAFISGSAFTGCNPLLVLSLFTSSSILSSRSGRGVGFFTVKFNATVSSDFGSTVKLFSVCLVASSNMGDN